jgi:DNA-binding XRE family transcriptional regulator
MVVMVRTRTWDDFYAEATARYTPEQRAFAEAYRAELRLGMDLITLRELRSLTQTQLAELSGVPQGQISRIECAVGVNPTQKTLLKLARALDADLRIVPRDTASD